MLMKNICQRKIQVNIHLTLLIEFAINSAISDKEVLLLFEQLIITRILAVEKVKHFEILAHQAGVFYF